MKNTPTHESLKLNMIVSRFTSVIILLFCTLNFTNIAAQDVDLPYDSLPKNDINIELFGSLVFYSINYERSLFRHRRFDYKIKAGIIYAPFIIEGISDYNAIGGNIEPKVTYTLNRNVFEFGVGYSYIYLYDKVTYSSFSIVYTYDLHLVVPRIGYKWHWRNMSRYVGVAFTPIIHTDRNEVGDQYVNPVFTPFGGISIGVKF